MDLLSEYGVLHGYEICHGESADGVITLVTSPDGRVKKFFNAVSGDLRRHRFHKTWGFMNSLTADQLKGMFPKSK